MSIKLKLCIYLILILVSGFSFAVDSDGDGLQDYQIAVGSQHTCALDDNGVQCWGRDVYGQSTVPTGLVNPVGVAAGHFHTCALKNNGVQCWGRNVYGQSAKIALMPSNFTLWPSFGCSLVRSRCLGPSVSGARAKQCGSITPGTDTREQIRNAGAVGKEGRRGLASAKCSVGLSVRGGRCESLVASGRPA